MAHVDRVTGVEALFADGGRSVLRDLRVTGWGDALAEVPPQLTAEPALAWLRDRWEGEGEVGPATAATHVLLAAHRERQGDDHQATLVELARLGGLLRAAGRPEGELLLEQAWERVVELAPSGDPDRARIAARLGLLRVAQDRAAEAIFPLREAAAALANLDPYVASEAEFRLGLAMVEFGSVEEGLRRVEAAVRAARQVAPPGPELPERLGVLARLVGERLPPKDAEGVHQEAVEAARRVHGDQSPEHAVAQAGLADLLWRIPGRSDEALGQLDVAVALLLGAVGPADPRTRQVAANLVERLMDVGRRAIEARDRSLARESLARAEAVAAGTFGPADGRVARVRDLVARIR